MAPENDTLGSLVWVLSELKGRRVSSLINFERKWNEDLIKAKFIKSDANSILNMPFRSQDSNDDIYWGHDFKGQFSIKSAYHFAIESKDGRKNVRISINK